MTARIVKKLNMSPAVRVENCTMSRSAMTKPVMRKMTVVATHARHCHTTWLPWLKCPSLSSTHLGYRREGTAERSLAR